MLLPFRVNALGFLIVHGVCAFGDALCRHVDRRMFISGMGSSGYGGQKHLLCCLQVAGQAGPQRDPVYVLGLKTEGPAVLSEA